MQSKHFHAAAFCFLSLFESTQLLAQVDARVIGGYQQGGASGSDSSGRFFFDSYDQLNITSYFALDGSARIGSGATDASAKVGTFVAGSASNVAALPLNKIATIGEAWAGFEAILPHKGDDATVSFFGRYGINGYLQTSELDQTYAFPANTTQSYKLLVAAYNSDPRNASINIATVCAVSSPSAIPAVSDNCQFVRFRTAQPSYYQEAYAGLRAQLKTPLDAWRDKPALISAGWGFNEIVGKYRRPSTVRLEGFLPVNLDFKKAAHLEIYLFGSSEFNYHRDAVSTRVDNYIGLDDPSNVKLPNGSGTQIAPNSGNTFIITTTRTPRDLYSIGVGIDLISACKLVGFCN